MVIRMKRAAHGIRVGQKMKIAGLDRIVTRVDAQLIHLRDMTKEDFRRQLDRATGKSTPGASLKDLVDQFTGGGLWGGL